MAENNAEQEDDPDLSNSHCSSQFGLIEQLERQSMKVAEDQNPDERRVYLIMLDDKDQGKTENAKAEAQKSYEDECRRLTQGPVCRAQPSLSFKDINVTSVFIAEKIDEGGYGAVYKARSETGQASVDKLCVKMGRHRKVRYVDGDERAKFQDEINKSIYREAEIFGKLSGKMHDNIIQFHFCCMSTEQEVMIGLEYFEGVNLSKTTSLYVEKNKTIGSGIIHDIILQSTAAVKFLQDQGIIHCDIKPHNILYNCKSQKLKFVDFGSAVHFSEIDGDVEEDELCWGAGTPEYMAPEILLKLDVKTKNCDIYSLGAIFYRLLTLERPWHFIERINDLRHCEKREEKKSKREVWNIIKGEYEKYLSAPEAHIDRLGEIPSVAETESSADDEKFTTLQKRIVDESTPYYTHNKNACELVKEMLSVNPNGRPACSAITARISEGGDHFSQLVTQMSVSSGVGSELAPDDSYIPHGVGALYSGCSMPTSDFSAAMKRDDSLLSNTTSSADTGIEMNGEENRTVSPPADEVEEVEGDFVPGQRRSLPDTVVHNPDDI